MNKIQKTLALYQAEGEITKTALELFLLLSKKEDKFYDFIFTLQKMENQNRIYSYLGFYYLTNEAESVFLKRIDSDKNAILKFKKAKRWIKIISLLPFVRSVSISGSLSMYGAGKKSDIDLFIIAEKDRIFTVRMLTFLITQLFLQRRHKEKINNKLCLNFYVQKGYVHKIQNEAFANLFLNMIPVYNKNEFFKFLDKNQWIADFFFGYPKDRESVFEISHPVFFQKIKLFFEKVLSGHFGNFLEKVFKYLQIKKAYKKNVPKNDFLVLTDEALILQWPKPRNKEVMEKFLKIIKSLG